MPSVPLKLGVFMRAVGRRLQNAEPLLIDQVCDSFPYGRSATGRRYAQLTMERLVKRTIAKTVQAEGGPGWVRGPAWKDAASRYAWTEDQKPLL